MKNLNPFGLIFLLVFFVIRSYGQPLFIKEIPANSTNFISANGKLYFTSGTDLYRSDGTTSGTTFVKAIGEPILEFTSLTVGSFFYFTTQEPGGKVALWKSNGYANNTFKIKSADFIKPLLTYNVSLYIGMDDGVHGYELWRVTSANVFSLVKDVYPGPGSGLGDEIVQFNDLLYFKGYNPVSGSNIWKTNGTSITNIAVDLPFTENYGYLTGVGSTLYFSRNYVVGDSSYAELWKTNGTTAGTSRVKQFIVEGYEAKSGVVQLTNFNNTLYFNYFYDFGVRFDNLYVSDGTESGTQYVTSVNVDGSMSDFFEVNNNLLYFGSSQGWPGSFMAINFSGPYAYIVSSLTTYSVRYAVVGNLLFYANHTELTFGADPGDSSKAFQLFQRDITTPNNVTLESIYGTSFSGSNDLTEVNGKLFFTRHNDDVTAGGCPFCPKKLYVYNPFSGLRAAIAEESLVELTTFPNPSEALFNFSLVSSENGNATAEIFRADGTLVAKVFDGATAKGEKLEFNWNAEGLAGGVYICRFTTGKKAIVKKLLLNN